MFFSVSKCETSFDATAPLLLLTLPPRGVICRDTPPVLDCIRGALTIVKRCCHMAISWDVRHRNVNQPASVVRPT